MRVDLLLVQRGVASTRSAAQRLLDAQGVQWRGAGSRDWITPKKSGDQVPDDCELQVVDPSETRYVSRGGLKLAGAMAHTGWQAAGLCCLDVGQSTGGFTDCLLQAGAAGVLGLDVGQGQLHARLRDHPGVVALSNATLGMYHLRRPLKPCSRAADRRLITGPRVQTQVFQMGMVLMPWSVIYRSFRR